MFARLLLHLVFAFDPFFHSLDKCMHVDYSRCHDDLILGDGKVVTQLLF